MRNRPELVLSANMGQEARVMYAIQAHERDAAFLRRTIVFCGVLLLLGGLKLAHHHMDLPGVGFLWELVLSLCS